MLLATRTVLGLFFAGSLWSLLAAPSDGQESQAKLAKAREALEAGRRREAERRFRAVVQKEPFRQDGYLGLAEAIAAQVVDSKRRRSSSSWGKSSFSLARTNWQERFWRRLPVSTRARGRRIST